jgi:hypothetical protein
MYDTNKITILHTARAKFDKSNADAWITYINWARLSQLTELVSVDQGLNEVLVEGDRNSEDFWNHTVLNGCYETGFFTSVDFVLNNMQPNDTFNLLAVSINPNVNCELIEIQDYDFLGYDLLDQYCDTSALTNCGGFDEVFLPSDLNHFGLIDKYEKAIDINKGLLKNYPDEEHADTNIIAIWRNKIIGVLK